MTTLLRIFVIGVFALFAVVGGLPRTGQARGGAPAEEHETQTWEVLHSRSSQERQMSVAGRAALSDVHAPSRRRGMRAFYAGKPPIVGHCFANGLRAPLRL